MTKTRLADIMARDQNELLKEWVRLQSDFLISRRDRLPEARLRASCQDFLTALTDALARSSGADTRTAEWAAVRDFLANFSRMRAAEGFTPSETAVFIFSLKQPVFARLRAEIPDPQALGDEIWAATELLDKLGLYTIEMYQESRESR